MADTNRAAAEELMRQAEACRFPDPRAPRLLEAAGVYALLAVCDALLDPRAP